MDSSTTMGTYTSCYSRWVEIQVGAEQTVKFTKVGELADNFL